jgi:hypothetical protein
MADISKLTRNSRRDVAYYIQRQRNRIFEELVAFIAEEAKRRGASKKELADVTERDPAQITRWLSAPSNFETDTITELLLPFDAEMEHRIVRFSDRAKANYAHPVIETLLGKQTMHPSSAVATETQKHESPAKINRKPDNVEVDARVTAVS